MEKSERTGLKCRRWALLLVGLSVLVSGCRGKEASIRIGASMPLTGEGASYGEPQRKAAALAVEEINEHGGLLGKKLSLDAQDDKGQAGDAVNVAHLFISTDGLAGVIGHPNSGNAIAASKIYHSRVLPYVATSPTNPLLTEQGFPNVFRFAPTDDMQGVSAAEFLWHRLKARAVVVIHDNAAYGKGLATQVKKHLESLGGKVLFSDALLAGEKDYRSLLAKAAEHKPEVVFFGGMMPEGALLVRQAEEMGFKTKIVFGDGCFDEQLKTLAGTPCRNVYVSFLAPPWDTVPSAKEFVRKYESRYGPVPAFAPYGYDAILVLAEGIRKAGSVDHERVIEAMHDPSFTVQGVTGKITFDKNGQTASRKFYFYTFNEHGKLALAE